LSNAENKIYKRETDVASLRLVDAETGSVWDFTEKAVSGELAGKQLTKISVLNNYWFDWKSYNGKAGLQFGQSLKRME